MEMELIFISEISQLAPELYAWLPILRNAWASERFRNDVCNMAYKNVRIGAIFFGGETDPSVSVALSGQSLRETNVLSIGDTLEKQTAVPRQLTTLPPTCPARKLWKAYPVISSFSKAFPEHLPRTA